MEYWNNSTFVGKGAFNGHSCLDYIGAHLGYRLIVRDAEAIKNQGGGYTVSVSIENTGFANMYMESLLYAEYAAEDGEKAIRFPKPLTECKAGIMVTFSVDVNDVCPGRICIYAIQAKGNKRIFFANEPVTMDGKLFIGVIK